MNEVLNCLETRRSCRAYRPEQVPEEALQEILRAGLYAPSGMGRQSVKLLVVQDPAAIAALERLNGGVLGSPEAHPFYGAPTVCVVLADAAAFTAVEDGSLALGNLMNAAHSLGIASCWIHRAREEFDSPEGKELLRTLGIKGDYEGIGNLIVGYPDGEIPEAKPRREGRVFYAK